MRSGRLRFKVKIEKNTPVHASPGVDTPSWSTFATVWADIQPLTGKEFFTGAELQAEVSHQIRIRYLDGVTSKMRVVYNSRIFEIEAVINRDERNKETVLACIEDVN